MPLVSQRIGPYNVFLSVDVDVDVPDLTGLVFTACDVDTIDALNNDVVSDLKTTDTYEVIMGLVGRDLLNKGYTVGACSSSSGAVTIAAIGHGIQVKVVNTDWPANFDTAVAAALFLKQNSSSTFQLCRFSYVDPDNDFSSMIFTKPLRVAPRFTSALLQSSTDDDILGNREPQGIGYSEITPTSGTMNVRRPVSNVSVSPNNAPDFQIATGRGVGLTFSALNNDIKAFVRAAAGVYVKYSDGTDIIEEALMSLATAQAIIRENRAVQIFLPADANGDQEVRLMIGLLTTNQIELTEAWSKTEPCLVNFQFDGAILDKLITNEHCEISYIRRAT